MEMKEIICGLGQQTNKQPLNQTLISGWRLREKQRINITWNHRPIKAVTVLQMGVNKQQPFLNFYQIVFVGKEIRVSAETSLSLWTRGAPEVQKVDVIPIIFHCGADVLRISHEFYLSLKSIYIVHDVCNEVTMSLDVSVDDVDVDVIGRCC